MLLLPNIHKNKKTLNTQQQLILLMLMYVDVVFPLPLPFEHVISCYDFILTLFLPLPLYQNS